LKFFMNLVIEVRGSSEFEIRLMIRRYIYFINFCFQSLSRNRNALLRCIIQIILSFFFLETATRNFWSTPFKCYSFLTISVIEICWFFLKFSLASSIFDNFRIQFFKLVSSIF
jgi:hypothetical protein